MNTYKPGDIVVTTYQQFGGDMLLYHYEKPFVALDGEVYHRVKSIGGLAHDALVADADLSSIGQRRYFTAGSKVFELRESDLHLYATAISPDGATDMADRLQAGYEAQGSPTADEVFLRIEHGTAEHRAWLREAVDDIFASAQQRALSPADADEANYQRQQGGD